MSKIYLFILIFYCTISFSQDAKEKDSLLYIATKSNNDSLRIVAYNKLFFNEVYSDLESSKQYYKAIFAIAKAKKSNFAYAKAYNLKGVAYDISGKMDSSYVFYKRAIYYAKKCNAYATEGSALNNIGLLDWNNGNFYQALLNYNKALLLFEKVENLQYQANALSNIGLIYDEINDLKKAESYLNKSFAIRKKISDEYGLSVCYVNLAKIFEKQKKYNLAIINYQNAINIKLKLNDLMGIALAQNNLSTSYLFLGKYKKAIEVLKNAEKICLENEAESNILENIYMAFVAVYIAKNELVLAKKYNQKLFDINKKTSDIERLNAYYQAETKIAVLEKNFQKAYLFDKRSDSLTNIIEGVELKKAINLFETKYQTEKKEKQLIIAKNLLFKNEIESKRKNIIILIISVITLFAIAFGYLFYRQQKLKNSQQEQEFKLKSAISAIESQNKLQEQRLEISRDLHDNIGSQLTFIISSIDNVKYAFDITNPKLDNKLSNISNFAKDTILELRDTIWAMNMSEFGFEDLRGRIYNFIEKAQSVKEDIDFKFTIDDNLKPVKFTSIVGISIYRTIQEAINNAIKYANATQITVAISLQNGKTNIVIKDNGEGFDVENIVAGNGLNNMNKRMDEIDAKFSIVSSKSSGTMVTLII